MNITQEQFKFLMDFMENKEKLQELFNIVNEEKDKKHLKQVKNLKIKDSINFAGITWSKFAEDEEGNAFMLADKCICNKEFGENNDWRTSQIRKELNEDLYNKIVSELGKDAIIPITVDLFSHDGLRDYGTCVDNFSLLTYDLYRNNRENIKACCNEAFWTNTPDSTPSGCGSGRVRYVYSGGDVGYGWCNFVEGVRPFCILKSSIFVSCNEVNG